MNARVAICRLAVALLVTIPAGAAPVAFSLKAGAPQSAPAYVAQHAARYEAVFPIPLAVNVGGGDGTKVRFTCETAGCVFPPAEVGDLATRVDEHSFDVRSKRGVASLAVTVSAPAPATVVVVARPVRGDAAPVRFVLTMR